MVRPLTYTFAARLLEAGGGELEEVRISRLADETFYAEAIVRAGGVTRAIDARPSDALNLAVLLGRPVTVAQEVLSVAAKDPGEPAGEERTAAGIVDDLLGRLGPVPVVRRRA
jgi:bifunctional DNase/RNase